jgi:hypothetical protein
MLARIEFTDAPGKNAGNPLDVNADGWFSPLDAS